MLTRMSSRTYIYSFTASLVGATQVLLFAPAYAQTAAPSASSAPAAVSIATTEPAVTAVAAGATGAPAAEGPFEGIVVEDDAKARAVAGRTFYVVGSIPKDTKITVDEIVFGWNKVVPPGGIHSYISKAFVDARGNGKVGDVNRDRAPVTAASLDGPGDSYRHQLDLNKGDQVTIVGEEGSFYKIASPNLAGRKAYVYLPPGSVRRVDVPVVAPPATTPPATTPPATTPPAVTPPATTPPSVTPPAVTPPATTPPATTPPAVTPPATTPPATTPPATTPPAVTPPAAAVVEPAPSTTPTVTSPAPIPSTTVVVEQYVVKPKTFSEIKGLTQPVKDLEARIANAQQVPVEQQPLEELIEAYSAATLLPNLSAQDKHVLRVRLIELQRNKRVADVLKDLANVKEKSAGNSPEIAKKVEAPDSAKPANYDATGLLMASSVYDGVRLPQLFRVVEPATMRTIVYVRPGPDFDTGRSLGRLVGIQGKARYDAALNLRIIDVDKLDVLEAVGPRLPQDPSSAAKADAVKATP